MTKYLTYKIHKTPHGEFSYGVFYGNLCFVNGDSYETEKQALDNAIKDYNKLKSILES